MGVSDIFLPIFSDGLDSRGLLQPRTLIFSHFLRGVWSLKEA